MPSSNLENFKITTPLLKILCFYVATSTKYGLSGVDVMKSTGLMSGTVYPVLIRMEEGGWLIGRDENVIPSEVKRPRRKFYKLTPKGKRQAQRLMREYIPDADKYLEWKKPIREILPA